MYRVRRGIDSGDWIPGEMRAIMDNKWKEDNWKKKAELNKVNRISSNGPLHTGGSIPTTEHYKRLVSNLIFLIALQLSITVRI
jgi:hypothetical protein